MELVAIGAILGFGAVMCVVLVVAVKKAREKAAQKKAMLEGMGFAAVATPDPEFVRRVVALSAQPSGDRVEPRKVHRMAVGGLECYLFDLWRLGHENHCVAADAVAVVVPELDLPRFTVIPKISMGGFLGRMLDALVKKLMARNMPIVACDACPDFADKYTLASDDADALRKAFAGDVLARLGRMPHYHIEGGGDALLLSRLRLTPGREADLKDALTQAVKDAVWLAGVLRKNAAGAMAS